MEQMWICPKGCKICKGDINHSIPHQKCWSCDEVSEIGYGCDIACVPVEQASSLLENLLLTDEEINKAELISVNDMKRIIQEASASVNKDREEFTVIEMELARKYSHQQIAKAQHAKTARLIFDELDKACLILDDKDREEFIAIKKRFTEGVNVR